ncbi:MAG: hypothetical protein H6685_09435 [Deltaproteobacteria bacterium]|nr:hypothetical protein [Deltaproteobacteria bacterium]
MTPISDDLQNPEESTKPRRLERFAPVVLLAAVIAFYSPMWWVLDGIGDADEYRRADALMALLYISHPRVAWDQFHEIPLRTHYYGGGYPVLQDPVSMHLNPLSVFFYAFGGIVGIKLTVLLGMWLGTIGVFFLARRVVRLSLLGAYFSALAFAFSGWFPSRLLIGNLEFFMPFTPLVLYWVMDAWADRRRLLYAGLLLGTIMFSGFVFVRGFLYLMFVIPAFWESYRRQPGERRGLAAVLGLMALLAIVSLPMAFARLGPLPIRFLIAAAIFGASPAHPRIRQWAKAAWPGAAAALVVFVIALGIGAGRIQATLSLLQQGEFGRMEGKEDFVNYIAFDSAGAFADAVVHHVPLQGIYGKQGWPEYHEAGYMGLTWTVLISFVVGIFVLRRRAAPWLLVLGLLVLASFGRFLPIDFYGWFMHWIPSFRFMSEPYKYFVLYIAMIAVLIGGAAFDLPSLTKFGRWRHIARFVAFLAFIAYPFAHNIVCVQRAFSMHVEQLPKADEFYNVLGAPSREDIAQGLDHVRRRSKEPKFREAIRPVYRQTVVNMRRGVGTIDWYANISIPENAVPAVYVLPDNSTEPNPEYRGEAHFMDEENRVLETHLTENTIRVEVETTRPGRLVINQNYDPAFRVTPGVLRPQDGLLSVDLTQPGRHSVELRYRPWSVLVPILLSLAFMAAVAVLAVFWPKSWSRPVKWLPQSGQ